LLRKSRQRKQKGKQKNPGHRFGIIKVCEQLFYQDWIICKLARMANSDKFCIAVKGNLTNGRPFYSSFVGAI
jgi:hypothetical protein